MIIYRQHDNLHLGVCVRVLADLRSSEGGGGALAGKLRAGDTGSAVVIEVPGALFPVKTAGGAGAVDVILTVPSGITGLVFAGVTWLS